MVNPDSWPQYPLSAWFGGKIFGKMAFGGRVFDQSNNVKVIELVHIMVKIIFLLVIK